LGYFVSGLYDTSHFVLNPITPIALHNGGREEVGFGKFDYALGDLDRLTFDTGAQSALLQIPNTPERESVGQNDFQQEDKSFANLIWHHDQEATQWSLAFFAFDSDAQYEGSPADLTEVPGSPAPDDDPLLLVNQDQEIHHYGVREDTTLGHSLNHQTQFGFEDTIAEGELNFSLLSEPGTGFAPLIDDQALSSTDSGAYVQKQYERGRLHVDYGARYDVHHADTSASQLSPRLEFNYQGDEKDSFQAFYNKLFMPVPVESIRNFQGNTILGDLTPGPAEPERDDYYGLGWKRAMGKATLNVDPYLKLIRDIVDNQQIGDTLIEVPINEAHGLIKGCDFSYDRPLSENWHFTGDYGLSRGTASGPITGGLNGLEALPPGNFLDDHDQTSTVCATFNYHQKRNYGLVQYEFASGLPWGEIDDTNGNPVKINFERVPSQSYINLGFGHHFTDKLSTSLSIDNLFNHAYDLIQDNEFRRSVYGDGRTLTLKTTLDF